MMTRKSFADDGDAKKLRREYAAEKAHRERLEVTLESKNQLIDRLNSRCEALAGDRARLEREIAKLRSDLITEVASRTVELEQVRRNGPAHKEIALWTELFVELAKLTGTKK